MGNGGVPTVAQNGNAAIMSLSGSIIPRSHSRLRVADDRIARFSGGAEYSFSGEATLSSDTHRKAWSRPPIGMEFSIVMFTSSGLLVRYLKVIEKSGYRYVYSKVGN